MRCRYRSQRWGTSRERDFNPSKPFEVAANIQLGTCSPNFLIQESIETFGGFDADLLTKPIQWQEGYIIPPTEPGLGVELNEAVADANPVTKDNAFPSMGEAPVIRD
ncbi:MAG: enolase C-terminal domain-like protein [Geminicoccales bacterium]